MQLDQGDMLTLLKIMIRCNPQNSTTYLPHKRAFTGYQPYNSRIEIHNMHFGDAAAGSGTCCMQETSKQVGGCIPYPSSSDF